MVDVKICGVKTPDILSVAADCGARFVGFVFVPRSPRFVEPEQARLLSRQIPTGLRSVGLFSDPDDETISRVTSVVSIDYIQLHGSESAARVAEIKSRSHLPVIKAFPVSSREDISSVSPYLPVIDWILFDAKRPADSDVTGGHGVAFDWTILKGQKFAKPWMLSGGLTPDNVAEALSILTPEAVDVSSGVEIRRGEKDAGKIHDFIAAVRNSG